jgi:predicted transcriptional regulator
MLERALHVNIKSFDLVSEITRQDLFSKVELKPVSRLIIFNLANMYNPKLGYTFPGIDKLARCTGYTDRQIKAGLKELFESGLIVRTDKKIYFTRKFYELLQVIQQENSSPDSEDNSPKSENTSLACHEQIKTNKLNNFVKDKILKFPDRIPGYLKDIEHAKAVLMSYNRFNLNPNAINVIKQIQEHWKFNSKDYDILIYLSSQEAHK